MPPSPLQAMTLRRIPLHRGSFAVVKEGIHKESGSRVAIKIVDKKDAVFDAESLEQEVKTMPIQLLLSAPPPTPDETAPLGTFAMAPTVQLLASA